MASPIRNGESTAVLPWAVHRSLRFIPERLSGTSIPLSAPKTNWQALLIWGGVTSVGSNDIQLAVAAGYEIITTASPKNFDYVKKLGASQVFDCNSKTIVDELIEAFKDTLLKSDGNKFIVACRHPPDNIPDGISTKFIFGSDPKDNKVSKVICVDFLPKALAEGKYIAAPDPQVVGKGLEYVQTRFDLQKKGMSAKKVVVSL